MFYSRDLDSFLGYGSGDADTDFFLNCLLERLDRSQHCDYLLQQMTFLGKSADGSAVRNFVEQMLEGDHKRCKLLQSARAIWRRIVEEEVPASKIGSP